MVHQPSGGFQGQATDIEIQAREIIELRARLNQIYVEHTGQELDFIEKAMDRDTFLTADKAKEFGLIDDVVQQRVVDVEDDDNSGTDSDESTRD